MRSGWWGTRTRSNYEYTEADVSQIVKAIEDELKVLKLRFKDVSSPGARNGFRLRGMDSDGR